MANAQGEGQRGAQAPVPLQVTVQLAVDGGAASREIGGVDRGPDTSREAVDRVSLDGGDRVLRTRPAAEEVRVLCVEGRPCRELQGERPERLRGADLRPEGPAVGAKVYRAAWIVLARGGAQREAGPKDQVLLVLPELQ